MFELSDIHIVRDGRAILSIPSLTLPTTELTVVLGHNGSGKSTLVNLLAGQSTPDQGRVTLDGKNLARYNQKMLARQLAFLPQKLPASAGLSVRELVRLGRFPWRGTFGRWHHDDNSIVNQSMGKAGVTAFADTLADNLSGGERQRAWVAMLLAQQSPVLILDEPTSALDIHHQYQLMNLLSELNKTQHVGIIVILHDLNLALQYASHIIALKKGEIAFEGEASILSDEQRLSDLYETRVKLIDHPEPLNHRKVAVICD
ncbi:MULTISPECIES: ABC transporter ATP-binding protein [Providencia]|uniref:ATP-binding component of an ABC superfamily ferrichrome transporter n=1 Tax=Providencia heimbachae ATCC 35613 TaxID=1354272 RepID=A0A1B7K2E5_9GAMM|nr:MULTISPECIES: ABC transporter ATP-binding protein [Providencia]MBP6121871.1 ABC transporter ATP-binding protein [Providencia sp.]MDD9340382.1 ABC transporter ATP-binding protein [Providencia heimbachae]NIH23080.1 ABC transporter ATP-binding protein [Providencia heimbachae]OAT54285.1 ATP-binding component of an ABC superfamily ferrichrome transporter [Providencia heimbachae ATCC 35613]QCJ70562.1 ABC transporter ATP-binding protein [Providencia heimbachae]